MPIRVLKPVSRDGILMSAITAYNHLSLSWTPQSKKDHRFNLFAVVVLSTTLFIGLILSSVELPPQVRSTQTIVPERIAKFLTDNKKPKKVKPIQKPLPKPKLKLRVKKKAPEKAKKNKPLTKAMKKARKKAATSGLLALNSELADLMDTSLIRTMLSGRTSKGRTRAAALNKDVLTKGAGTGSGGVGKQTQYLATSNTKLSQKELKNFRASLLAKNTVQKPNRGSFSKASIRLEEQVTIIFDQNKSKLYSLYNRARRKNPSLKGKLILEITINPSGMVERVRIVVSELNDAALEKRIVMRVKQFNFGPSGKEKITVTFPIEFIPS